MAINANVYTDVLPIFLAASRRKGQKALMSDKTHEILTIIPARLASTRLPAKPLADILGQSMIMRVYNQALKANIGPVLVACGDVEIKDHVEENGGIAVMTDPALPSGSDRVRAAMELFDPCLLYTSPSPRDQRGSRMPSSA